MKYLLTILVLFPVLLFGQKVDHAARPTQKTITLSDNRVKAVDLSMAAVVFRETDEHYTFEQIKTGWYEYLFSSVTDRTVTYKGYDAYLWEKVAIKSATGVPVTWILKTGKLLSEVTAYIVHTDGKTEIQKTGWSIPPSERTIVDPDNIFKISLREQDSVTVYLRIHSNLRWSSVDKITLTLIPEAHWNSSKLRHYNFLSVYAGICFLATFYWLINFIFSRRVNYLYLITATLSALIFCLDAYGLTSVFFSSDRWYFIAKYGQQYLWYPLLIISHFVISYKTNSFTTYFSKNIIYCFWLVCFGTVAFLLFGHLLFNWKYAHIISMSMILLCMALGVVIMAYLFLKRGFGTNGFAFLAILPIFIGMSAYVFLSLGLISEQYKIAAPIGALLTVIMYFYGMVHYLRALRDKRNNEILKNDMLIRQQNVVLEKTVEERTAELKIANVELSTALQHLKETHIQLIEAEKLKVDEKINTLLKEQELKSVNEMLEVQENERKRIATDLHDRLGSMLSTVKLYFNSVAEQMEALKQQSIDQYDKASSLLDEAVEEVRKISHDLVSGELIKFGLVPALRQLAKTIEDTGQLKMKVDAYGMEERLESSVEIALYRMIQELLNNILKHSGAKVVSVQLNRHQDELNVIVEDNGIGFDVTAAKVSGGMGLKNIETRVSKLNGRIHFDSEKGRGTITIIDVPV